MSAKGLWITGPDTLWVAEDHVIALAEYLRTLGVRCAQLARFVVSVQAPDQDPWAVMDWGVVATMSREIEHLGERARSIESSLREYALRCAEQERARRTYFEAPRDALVATVFVSLSGSPRPLSDEPLGFAEAARSVLGEGYQPGSVRVDRAPGVFAPLAQADTLEERIRRIPSSATPIRIERYRHGDGEVTTEVFIAGTSDWALGTTDNPFDLESNLALVAGVPAVSYVAVEMALRRAGVRAGDRVTFVGHSQGGLIAARMAESGRYTTTGLLTAGAPLGGVPIRGHYPAVSLAHTDDPVPGLGGVASPTRSVGVERHSGAERGDVSAAHSLEAYARTASAADSSPARGHFGPWSGSGNTVSPEFFRASRTPGG